MSASPPAAMRALHNKTPSFAGDNNIVEKMRKKHCLREPIPLADH